MIGEKFELMGFLFFSLSIGIFEQQFKKFAFSSFSWLEIIQFHLDFMIEKLVHGQKAIDFNSVSCLKNQLI